MRIVDSVVNRLGIAGELLRFFWQRKWWWLSPMIVMLLVRPNGIVARKGLA